MFCTENWLYPYKRAVNDFITFSGKSLSDLKKLAPKALCELIDSVFYNSGYSVSSKLLKISAVRVYLEDELSIVLPRSKVRKQLAKKKLRHSNKENLSSSEVKTFISYFSEKVSKVSGVKKIPALRNLLIVKLLAFTGQRIGDILNLTVKNCKKKVLLFKQEKTGVEVSIENPVIPEVLQYLAILESRLSDDDFIFADGLMKHPLSYIIVYHFVKEAGLLLFQRQITPHCFRKYVISKLISSGHTSESIKSVSGHSNAAMVDYYGDQVVEIKDLKRKLMR